MTDTSPEISSSVHVRLMAKTGAERFPMGVRRHEAARSRVNLNVDPVTARKYHDAPRQREGARTDRVRGDPAVRGRRIKPSPRMVPRAPTPASCLAPTSAQ